MKVLQINSVCGIGSTGRIVIDIRKVLMREGHKSYVAYGRESTYSGQDFVKIGNRKDQYAHVFTTRLFDNHGFSSKKATIDFLLKVDQIKPDIIHLHNIHGYYLNIEILIF